MKDEVTPPLSPERLLPFLSEPSRREAVEKSHERIRRVLHGRTLFHVSSAMQVGGLAALLRSQVAYARGIGVDAHWELIDAPHDFLQLAKGIHNRLHGLREAGPFGEEVRFLYEHGLEDAAAQLAERVKPGDLVVLHDPQTAGLAAAAKLAGAQVIWRCHVGLDVPNDAAREAWEFLHPYVAQADAYVFSREQFVWETLDRERCFAIPPVINPVGPTNETLSDRTVAGILSVAGLAPDGTESSFVRLDGSPGRVDRRMTVMGGPRLDQESPVLLQVSNWNRLKDPRGVVRMFAEFVAPQSPAHLVVAGPAIETVPAETEAEEVYQETLDALAELPADVRARIHVVTIPNDDPEEGAAIVNALQRRAAVVLQKSRGEGFGLPVMEAMWKRRPVVCSRVGGLQEQVVDGETGFLIERDDQEEAGSKTLALLQDQRLAESMGRAGHERVAEQFLLPHDIPRWIAVMEFAYGRKAAPQHA